MSSRSEALQVFLRVRPPISKEIKSENAIIVRGTQALTLTSEKQETYCTYDHVFNELSDQSHVFEKIKPLLVDVLSGLIFIILIVFYDFGYNKIVFITK